jgi:capsule biosynthesis phosphatase
VKKKIFCFDLDNTICKTKKNNYSTSKPIRENISALNSLFENGHEIIIFTARGMNTFKGDLKLIKKNYMKFTKNQLNSWGVKYDKLIFGKPSFDFIIDDKSIFYKKNWARIIKK